MNKNWLANDSRPSASTFTMPHTLSAFVFFASLLSLCTIANAQNLTPEVIASPYQFIKWDFPNNTHDCAWPIKRMELDAAHKLFPAAIKPGQGVVIGAIDTGYIPTESIMDDGSLPTRGVLVREFVPGGRAIGIQNFMEGGEPYDLDPEAENFGHGTMVLNLIGGRTHSQDVKATGWRSIAPWVQSIPFRVTSNVVVFNSSDDPRVLKMANGLQAAVNADVNVINVSLASLTDSSGRIRSAMAAAERKGIIVVSASAQFSPISFVPYPASIPTVIATTAADKNDKVWEKANLGSAIDIAAPAVDMCSPRAANTPDGFLLEHDSGKTMRWGHLFVSGGRGTSYSSAFVSGAAALWLSYHGPENISRRYGKQNTAKLFRYMLKKYGVDTPPNWNTQQAGAGILNIRKLLEAPLPESLPNSAAF
jgi:serine protease